MIFDRFRRFFGKFGEKNRRKIPRKSPRKSGKFRACFFSAFFEFPVRGAVCPGEKKGEIWGKFSPEIFRISENFPKFRKKKCQKWPFLAFLTHLGTRVFGGALLRSRNTKKRKKNSGTFKNRVPEKTRNFPPRKSRFLALSAQNRGKHVFRKCVPMVLHRLLPWFHILYNSTAK